MTAFDLVVIILLLGSLILGLWRGLVHEMLSVLGWPVAYLFSKWLSASVAPFMPFTQDVLRMLAAYIVVFVLSLIFWSLLVALLKKLVKALGLGTLDVVLGGAMGMLRGSMVVVALTCLAGMTRIPEQPFWRHAQTSGMAEQLAELAKIYMPENISQRIHFPARHST
jgi:membrane protein required for colicin V production